MDEQISINDFLREQGPIEYGERSCRACEWFRSEPGRCYWAIQRDKPNRPKNEFFYPSCDDGDSHFEPSEYKVPRMCSNCKWGNQFEYETKPEYEEDLKRHNGYTKKAANDPLETPNIYCDHPEGSLNRRTEYKDREWANFGIGHWHRQHEWDTCDRWELERGDYRDFSEIEKTLGGKDGKGKESN